MSPPADASRMAELAEMSVAVRSSAARQRKALVGAPLHVQVPALVDPTPELERYTLGSLFGPIGGSYRGLFPGVGPRTLGRVLEELSSRGGYGRRNWHPDLRLGALTHRERRWLLKRLMAAPRIGQPRRVQGRAA
jgi:hypothetical protein